MPQGLMLLKELPDEDYLHRLQDQGVLRASMTFLPGGCYAGAGLFSIPLARRGHRVLAVEENPLAVADGIASLRLNRLPREACRFLRGRVEEVLKRLTGSLESGGKRFGSVILDPPRDGCPSWAWSLLLKRLRPARIIYVSCNPDALAAELPVILKAGYRVTRAQAVDMFPHTNHIETVIAFARR